MPAPDSFLRLLDADAPREAYDDLLAQLTQADPGAAETHADAHARALRLREALQLHRGREAELAALYETASDLSGMRDLDTVLTAIVRRARQLLRADMTYLSLNDEAEGASYMRVTDGALTPEFGRLRLPLGTGLLGLVAQSGAPYFTADYQADERFLHRGFVDEAVAGEQIRAILGVPLEVEGRVIGALLAVHRRVRPFPPGEVALLTSFAAHAAVALENARLFDQARAAVAEADAATEALRRRTESVERAAAAHDRLTDALLAGAGVQEIAEALGASLGGTVAVVDDAGRALAPSSSGTTGPAETPAAPDAAVSEAIRTGRSVAAGDGVRVAAAVAGGEHLGTLVARTDGELPDAERRTLERGALVVALVLLFERTAAEAEERARGDLLTDLLDQRGDPARLAARARHRGVRLEALTSVVVADLVDDDLRAASRAAARLAAEHDGLAGTHEGRLVLAGADADPLGLAAALRSRLAPTATLGAASGDDLRAGHREALRCVETLLALGRAGTTSDPAGLGVARLVLGPSGPADVDDFVAATLGPVLAWDEARGSRLVDTLDAWFAAGARPAAAAERLHVHPNTVAQRLDRVGRLLGGDWRSPDRALDLQLALRLHHLQAPSGSSAH